MTIHRETVLNFAKSKTDFSSSEVAELLQVSRQAATATLRKLVALGELTKTGSHRSTRYRFNAKRYEKSYTKTYRIDDLSEDRVYREFEMRLALKSNLSAQLRSIVAYGVTEMVNNAIDHSGSPDVTLTMKLDHHDISFAVEDRGCGCFERVKSAFQLQDYFDAVEHLLKGRQTTQPERHSGQGIFFTSKVADQFFLKANSLELVVDNKIDDTILNDSSVDTGTVVNFRISLQSDRILRQVFEEYADDQFRFTKTKVLIKLSRRPTEHLSRSQAKRLLTGLDEFTHIVLDFRDVEGIGQGFADEIFRVYRNAHPGTTLEPINMSQSVRFMIQRS